MGIESAIAYGIGGFLLERYALQGASGGRMGGLAAALWGGLMTPDAGEMSDVYDKRRATLKETLRDVFGFEMPDGLFGNGDAKKGGDDLKPNRERAEGEAERREKKDGFPWGKVLLGLAGATFGVNLLDRLSLGPFSQPLYAALGPWQNGVFPDPITMALQLAGQNILL